MTVLVHPDPVVLERELLARVDAAHPRQSAARTLVVVPTARLARHVERRLAGVRPAWLGLEALHLNALAYRILDDAGKKPPRVVSSLLLDAVLERVLTEHGANSWARFVRTRPGALGRLRAALDDLREAWIDPADVASCSEGGAERALAEVYRGYSDALARGARNGWGDRAALGRAALEHAEGFGAGSTAVFLHGAYELIGIHLDLLRALDRTTGVTALLPVRAGAPATAFAERFLHDFLLRDSETPEPIEAGDPTRPELAALYDEASRPAAGPVRFAFRHTQGEAAEVKVALREALESVRLGCPPEEIVVAARTLEPYAAALEEGFDAEDVPVSSSLAGPLRRYPTVRDFLLLLEVVGEDFPRRPTAELLRSPRIDWPSVAAGATPFELDRADRLSRQARILGGLDEWTTDLPRAGHGADERAARTIDSVLTALRAEIDPAPRSWSDHAARLGRSLRALFPHEGQGQAGEAVRRLEQLLLEMRGLETLVGEGTPIRFDEMRRWLEEAVAKTTLPLERRDQGGIRVLDLMQLRGLTCRRLHLLGLNSGLFPRIHRDDPILTERLAQKLRARVRRPLPVRAGAAEERLLLLLAVGAASEGVDVSWQRADEAGRAKTPSLALRELARLATGEPDVSALGTDHVPSHPEHVLVHLLARPGLLSPEEQLLLAALHSRGPQSLSALAARFPALAPGVAMLNATQGFRIVDPAFDGRIGAAAIQADVSVSALETLGRCPLRFFFQHLLGVRELDEPASALEITPRDLGLHVHDVLERLYGTLLAEGLFDGGSTTALRQRAAELLLGERPRILGELGARLARRLPVLGEHLHTSWLDAVRDFVNADLGWLGEHGLAPQALEQSREATFELEGSAALRIRARFDRSVPRDGGFLVGDYKTSGVLADRVNPTQMLKAQRLQVPLYALIAGPHSAVELLGVGPDFAYDDERGYRFRFGGFEKEVQERSFRETMRTLLELHQRGSFPLHKQDPGCGWCPYAAACRQNHPPTIDREAIASDSAAYRRLARKSARYPEAGGPGSPS